MVPGSCHLQCRQAVATLVLLMCSVSHFAQARSGPQHFAHKLTPVDDEQDQKQTPESELQVVALDGEVDNSEATSIISRRLKFLDPTPALVLPYHNGPLLSSPTGIPVYLIWYGTFTSAQKSIVTDFFASFSSGGHPTVSSWWQLTSGYKDSANGAVSSTVVLGGQTSVSYTLGTALSEADVESLVVDSLTTFPSISDGIYLLLTAVDVMVSDFCMNSCGSHFATLPSGATSGKQLPYAWVGNPGGSAECSGLCAWPYAVDSSNGPSGATPLVSPNGDVGMDGMMINIGVILAGTATDPFLNGFYQGDASSPLEAASACAGIFGPEAYPGNPGQLLVDGATGASYNVNGANGRKYLMPSLWDPNTLACASPA